MFKEIIFLNHRTFGSHFEKAQNGRDSLVVLHLLGFN